jgi:hypothetical protein
MATETYAAKGTGLPRNQKLNVWNIAGEEKI